MMSLDLLREFRPIQYRPPTQAAFFILSRHAWQGDTMNDQEFLLHVFKGDEHAVRLALDLAYVVGIWDDLIDRDKDTTSHDVNTAFATAMVGMPRNPFFQRFSHELLPVMSIGITNYLIANQYEKGDREARVLAHVMRYSIADVVTHMAALIGGMDWAENVGPELRRRSQRDTLDNYLQEMEKKHHAAQKPA